MNDTTTLRKSQLFTARGVPKPRSRMRIRAGLFITITGFFIFIVGAKPEWLGWSRSSEIGFVQIAVFLVGLAVICLGGYIGLLALWGNGQRSIGADIGLRLVSTGYVISVFSGMADIFGMGTHPFPGVPYFGWLQEAGVIIGEVVIGIGFLLLIPYGRKNSTQK